MKKKLALLGILAAGITSSIAIPSASAAPVHAACGAGYVSASLPWGSKCLRSGEFCKIGNVAYMRFGFTCPPSGHLRRR